MNGETYRRELSQKPLPVLIAIHRHVFLTPPPSSMRKPELIECLGCKFDELNKDAPIFVHEEEPEPPAPPPKQPPQHRKPRNPHSRRNRIIQEVPLNIWDTETLAEALFIENPEWKIKNNKTAIAGTLADLRTKGWKVRVDKGLEKGRIIVGDLKRKPVKDL